ncbi:mechanosensitive ion channel [Sulfitobacter geojensis]|uniref:Small-conductance mechanosensitive channel n=3 Tax=Sulfitobacter geojensis TaxID=1342299 RepID=A0AAE3B743_9RHOB|nr:mechanosensitive ion channel domain-containing protein [Sulfitobacter geojensis]MBM1690556.1 mechanosensitive ion channel [Sulfitobacter geojensis]MBM1694622.1 mechanosensitive ion channel [Sulfitobacter geojensis]MBM1706788.1 mechanosensitive ion channel [Sulfitobacter geojensis]MBM1710846.1 mechanosensitive ion channel [Sulfitobacter geojensis]MBM1714912.1 mechanosensitive ion channel [Sulfitobacter geojensis]
MESMMTTEIWQGKSLSDLLTLEFLASAAGSLLGAIAILLLGWIVSAWLQRRVSSLGRKNKHLDEMLFDFLASIVRYVVLGFTLLFVLNTFGVQTTSVVAVIGAAGLAIGLALQGTLSNVAAGVMLILFRPIKIGDFVEVADEMGTVKQINLNFTELADLSNVQVIVPNSEVWGNVITNYSTNDKRRAEWTFGVGYGANLKDAETIIRDTIMADARAHADPEPFIQVTNLGDSSVDFLVRVWCNASEYFAFRADMTRQVKEALDAGGVDIPFPTRTMIQASS